MDIIKPTPKELIASMNRSGYLLESEISKLLADNGFFVETNPVIKDKVTGKNREIDLVAEYYRSGSGEKTVCKMHFIFEIKNNAAPFVLLTNYNNTPTVEPYLGTREIITKPMDLTFFQEDFYFKVIDGNFEKIFTQYCTFQFKKEIKKDPITNKTFQELMAVHPENIYESIPKIVQMCDDAIDKWDETVSEYFRYFLYLPILLLRDDLYELQHTPTGRPKLKKVDSSILVHNYLKNDEPSMAFIFVITKKGFFQFMNSMLDLEKEIENNMLEVHRKFLKQKPKK